MAQRVLNIKKDVFIDVLSMEFGKITINLNGLSNTCGSIWLHQSSSCLSSVSRYDLLDFKYKKTSITIWLHREEDGEKLLSDIDKLFEENYAVL